MKCPFCDKMNDRVINSRIADEGRKIRRRRECLNCKGRFTTFEVIENIPLIVVKRNSRRELFDKQKIINGLVRACVKRNISIEKIMEIADSVEKIIENTLKREVDSSAIGEMILRKLKNLDEVAYVRFASVYRSFSNIQEFSNELKQLQGK